MCQLNALAITKEPGITGFKATLCLCQVAAGERVPTWLVAGIGRAWQRPTMCKHPHAMLASTCVRLTVVAMYNCVQKEWADSWWLQMTVSTRGSQE